MDTAVTSLEGGKEGRREGGKEGRREGGCRGIAPASGMAAATSLLHLLSARDEVVAGGGLYGGVYHLLKTVHARLTCRRRAPGARGRPSRPVLGCCA
ncbi:MAG: PLP-dependent transferase [Clostridia bacterium]